VSFQRKQNWSKIDRRGAHALSSFMPDCAANSFTESVTFDASATEDDRASMLPLYCVAKMAGNEPTELAIRSRPLESTIAAGILSLPGLLWEGFEMGPNEIDTGVFGEAAVSNVCLIIVRSASQQKHAAAAAKCFECPT
jgi:hypothetical protein